MTEDDKDFYKQATWKESFTLFGTVCDESNDRIWPLTWYYKGTAVRQGPQFLEIQIRRLTPTAYLFLVLKGVITNQND